MSNKEPKVSIQKQTPEERKDRARWARILKTYGLTKEQYDNLNTGTCPICLRLWSDTVVPCIDHDHSTGEIRGLACRYCNRYLIGRHRNPDLVRRVADYLQGPHTGFIAPKKKRKVKRKKNVKKP